MKKPVKHCVKVHPKYVGRDTMVVKRIAAVAGMKNTAVLRRFRSKTTSTLYREATRKRQCRQKLNIQYWLALANNTTMAVTIGRVVHQQVDTTVKMSILIPMLMMIPQKCEMAVDIRWKRLPFRTKKKFRY